jgi:hypothetical protein
MKSFFDYQITFNQNRHTRYATPSGAHEESQRPSIPIQVP